MFLYTTDSIFFSQPKVDLNEILMLIENTSAIDVKQATEDLLITAF